MSIRILKARGSLLYTVESVEETDTLTEKDPVRDILQGRHRIIHDGIEVGVLTRILKENHGIKGGLL
ncbi:hypothetical protein ACSAZL_00845 [Methanosarcina sp. T3]|uniref:hypothetical protein n=1 Tax=Methanosarcina sp. T3 TaxID=3439062 RepID=UPI003F86D7B2